jgi:hypothetical protein
MSRILIGVAGVALTAFGLACAHEAGVRSQPQTAGGELAFDTLQPPMGTGVVLRVQNESHTPVAVFAEANEDTNQVASVAAGATQDVGLGMDFFRFSLTTFEVRPVNDTGSTLLGPLSLNAGDRVRIVVSGKRDSSHVYQNGNW